MNIQIFGDIKNNESKKAERFFKERGIKYQYIDMRKFGISRGELLSVIKSAGYENVINTQDPDYALVKYLASEDAKTEKILENQYLINVPIVRNGKFATVGFCPDVWKKWE